jgi:hypothetical protein
MERPPSKPKKNPLLGAAVVKQVLRRQGPGASSALYQGLLRDLGLTDAQVEQYLKEHADEVETALQTHGRRG